MCAEHGEPDQKKAPASENRQSRGREERDATGSERGSRPVEIGGPRGPEPTRYGDWERNGRCFDF